MFSNLEKCLIIYSLLITFSIFVLEYHYSSEYHKLGHECNLKLHELEYETCPCRLINSNSTINDLNFTPFSE